MGRDDTEVTMGRSGPVHTLASGSPVHEAAMGVRCSAVSGSVHVRESTGVRAMPIVYTAQACGFVHTHTAFGCPPALGELNLAFS